MKYKFAALCWSLIFSNIDLIRTDEVCDELGTCSEINIIPKGANEHGTPRIASTECVDRHEQCIQFVEQGECTNNPGWMIINCPKSCDQCRLRDSSLRCSRDFLNMSTVPIYNPGDLNSMFSNITARFEGRYKIDILSRSPWVVVFDNFMTHKETRALIRTVQKWERSTDTGTTNEFGETGRILSEGRTSSNAWCSEECLAHPDVQTLIKKIEEVTYVPSSHYESFQILKYERSQKYNAHHDCSPEDILLACGPRILTFFLYLSDVEEGGETAFPSLNIAVKPVKGRGLLWPSTLDSNPAMQDIRTIHEARPVLKGIKYAANSWIHLYNYKVPNLWGCTGSFDEL